MQIVILAGGKGNRLRPLTLDIPKPMLIIHGKPFLQYQIELMKSFGLNSFLLLIGYLGSHIESYFGDGSNLGLEIKYSYEKTLLGTAGALKNAEDKLSNEFLLLNGDTYLPIDYSKLIKYFYQCRKMSMLTAYSNCENKISHNMRIDKTNFVIDYNKKITSGMTHVDAGAMIFKKEILNFIPKNKVYSLEEDIFRKLIAMRELAAFPTKEKFYDMGTPEGLKAIGEILR